MLPSRLIEVVWNDIGMTIHPLNQDRPETKSAIQTQTCNMAYKIKWPIFSLHFLIWLKVDTCGKYMVSLTQ